MSRSNHLWFRYGLSLEDYGAKLVEQGGLCKVCRRSPEVRNGVEWPLVVDHDHVSQLNRDLLCDTCNKILGFVKDSQEHLRRLQEYLVRHHGVKKDFVENNPETAATLEQAWEQSQMSI